MPDAAIPAIGTSLGFAEPGLLGRILDETVEMAWEPGWAPLALARLVKLCGSLRETLCQEGWAEAVRVLHAHPLRRLVHEDPLSALSFETAGRDMPAMLDLAMGHAAARERLSGMSRAGLDFLATSSELGHFAMLRATTRYTARIIDAVAEQKPGAEVLTLCAGHLREAGFSVSGGRLSRWVSQETRREALAEIRRSVPAGLPVRPLHCSLSHFTRRPYVRGCFDLITLASLPEELPPEKLRDLVEAAFEALKPGGLLVLGSAAEAPREAAFLDAFLRLQPRWRSPEELGAVAAGIPARKVARRRLFRGPNGRRIFLLIDRVA